MKKKLVSVLMVSIMVASSISMSSAASLDPATEAFLEDANLDDGFTGEETVVPEMETDTQEAGNVNDLVTENEPEFLPDTASQETETQSDEFGSTSKAFTLKTENADIFFVSDLKKLKEGTLENPDLKAESTLETEADTSEKQEQRKAAITAANEILPDEYASLLTDDSYNLLMKQKHMYKVSSAVDFYVVPMNGYEVDTVKVSSALYGDLPVTDFENNVYEVSVPDDDVTVEVKTKEPLPPETESEPESETEAQTETESESESEPEVVEETESEAVPEEHFLESSANKNNLDSSQFTSQRLVLLSSDENIVVDPEHLIGEYGNIYLLQYNSVEQTMNAYVYYLERAEAVEPDTAVAAASNVEQEEAEIPSEVTANEIDNPISTLAGEQDSAAVQEENKVIALLDTGAEGSNIIDQVSMIDGELVGSSSHASDMVAFITEQNPDAKVLSVRVLGDDNLGTVSSIVAGMEYAISQGVDFINLSLYAKKSLSNSVLASEIQKAVDAGIEVVGSAGNDGADVINYMPGSVESAWIIGACDENGNRIESSNYGATVDYNVVASSTSAAAAKFTGYISAKGIDKIKSPIIFTADGKTTDKEEISDKEEAFEGAAVASGTQEWGKASIDYTTAATYFSSRGCSSVSITGHTQKSKTDTDGGLIFYGSKDQRLQATLLNAGYTYINGIRTAMDVKITGKASTDAGFCFKVLKISDGNFNLSVIDGKNFTGAYTAGRHETDLNFYFYKHGQTNGAALTVSGVMQLMDIDQEEGFQFDSSMTGIYTTSNTDIRYNSSTKWVTGSVSTDEATTDHKHGVQITFSSASGSPLHIVYLSGIGSSQRGTFFSSGDVRIKYHLLNKPSGSYTPETIYIASGAKTSTTAAKNAILNDYADLAGYNFSGWKTDRELTGDFKGYNCQTEDVDLYGKYTKQTGTLEVIKNLTGEPYDGFYSNVPNNKKTFSFTVKGTATNGETVNETVSVVGGSSKTKDLPVGTYKVTEVYDSGEWTCTKASKSVTIKEGKIATVTFENAVGTGNITVTKEISNITEDALTNPDDLKFKFKLYGTSNYGTTENYERELTGTGSVNFDSIPIGTYTLQEYDYDEEIWTPSEASIQVTIVKNTTQTFTITNAFQPERTPQPAPIKSLNEEWDEEKRLETKTVNNRFEQVTFSIFQEIRASSHEAVAPTSLSICDELDRAFEYKSFKAYVSTDNGTSWTEDTSEFEESTLETTYDPDLNSDFATTLFLDKEKDSFVSAEMYRFDITVKIKDGYNLNSYVQKVNGKNMYVIPNKASSTFIYKYGTPTKVTQSTNEVRVLMPLDELNVSVKKTNEVTGENIPNAEFTLYEWDGKDYSINAGIMEYNSRQEKYIKDHIKKTDTNLGKFKIVETVTPWGYVGSWSKEILIGSDSDLELEATNPMGMGTITVLKKGSHEEVLSGAVFSIKAKENIVSPQGKVLVSAGKEVDRITSGSNGIAKSKKLYPGKYEVTEIQAPFGYSLNKTPQEAEIKYKDKNTAVTNTDITVINESTFDTITVTKDLDYNDIVWAHGNPTFTFKVEGTDLLGKSHTYYETIEFTSEDKPDENDIVSRSVTFEVYAGTYTVSEEKTARYELNAIYDVVNGTVKGNTALLNVAEGANAAATFYNVKTTDEDLSHTAFVSNVIAD